MATQPPRARARDTCQNAESVRERFFQSASDVGVPIDDAEHFWNAALNGDEDIWELIEGTCGVTVVVSNAGFV